MGNTGKIRYTYLNIGMILHIYETYYSNDEIIEDDGSKKAKVSGSSVEWMEEESYFFKLSSYENKLLDYYNKILIFSACK